MYKLLKPVAIAVLAAFASQTLGAVLFFQSQPHTLAITDFTSTGTNPNADYLATDLPQSVSVSLAQRGRLAVVPRDQIVRAQEEITTSSAVAQEVQAAAQLGRAVGAEAILTGTFSAVGSMVKIDVRLIDVQTGSLLYEKSHYMLEGSALSDLATEIARDAETQLAGAAPEPAPQVSQSTPAATTGPVQPLPPEPTTAVTAASTGFQWWYWVLIGAGAVGGVLAVKALIQSSGPNSTVSVDFPLP